MTGYVASRNIFRSPETTSVNLLSVAVALFMASVTEPSELPRKLRPYMTRELVDIFIPGEFTMPPDLGYQRIEYQLFAPISREAVRFPLIVFFNGHGKIQREFGNLGQLKHLQEIIFTDASHPEKYPFYLLAIRCPDDDSGKWLRWFNDRGQDTQNGCVEPIEAAMMALKDIINKYPIDQDRISLLGISSGGSAALEIAMRYPKRFSAIVSTASTGGDASRLKEIVGVPIWIFNSAGDHPERARQTAERLNELGGQALYTEIESNDHDCWTAAFQEYDALEWMLANDRSSKTIPWRARFGWQQFKYNFLRADAWHERWNEVWPFAVPVVGMAVCYYAVRRDMRKRESKTSTATSQSGPPEAV